MKYTQVKSISLSFFALLAVSAQAEIEIQSQATIDPFTIGDETIRELAGAVRGKTTKHSVALIDFKPNGQSVKHYHPKIEETYFVLEGKGRVEIGNEKADLTKGQLVVIPPMAVHQVFNTSDKDELKLLVVAAEPWTEGCQVYVK